MAEIKAQFLKGIGSSDGIAIAKTYLLDKPQINVDRTKTIDNIDEAIKSLEKTIATTTTQLEKIKDIATEKLGEEKGEIVKNNIYLLPIRNVGSLCLALHLNLLHILFALV